MEQLANRTFDEIEVGATDCVTRRLTATEVEALSLVAGDVETFHLDVDDAGDARRSHRRRAPRGSHSSPAS